MTARSSRAGQAARRLWARHHVPDATTADSLAAASERVFNELRTTLSRWVGQDGFRSLWQRAVGLARPTHPELGALTGEIGDANAIAAAVRVHGATAVAADLLAVVVALVDVLGRIIGEDLAVRLVEQRGASSPPRPMTVGKAGSRNG